jgi:hypothetical protein
MQAISWSGQRVDQRDFVLKGKKLVDTVQPNENNQYIIPLKWAQAYLLTIPANKSELHTV